MLLNQDTKGPFCYHIVMKSLGSGIVGYQSGNQPWQAIFNLQIKEKKGRR